MMHQPASWLQTKIESLRSGSEAPNDAVPFECLNDAPRRIRISLPDLPRRPDLKLSVPTDTAAEVASGRALEK